MANVANLAPSLFMSYVADLQMVAVVLDTGPAKVPNGGVSSRAAVAQPLTSSGPTLPTGPQWFPLTG